MYEEPQGWKHFIDVGNGFQKSLAFCMQIGG